MISDTLQSDFLMDNRPLRGGPGIDLKLDAGKSKELPFDPDKSIATSILLALEPN